MELASWEFFAMEFLRIVPVSYTHLQNEVVGELIRAGKIDEEYMYPFVDTDDEVFEWWLVSPYLARELKSRARS